MTAGTTHVTSSIPTRGLFVRQLAGRFRSRDRLGHRAASPRHRGTASHRAPEDAVALRWPSRGRLGGVRAAAGGSDIRRRADLRCAVPTAGSLCITAAAILLRFTNGLPRMPMAATAPRRRSGARCGASGGALALRREGAGFVIEAARTEGFDRPWSPQRARRAAAPASPDAATDVPPASRSPPRDATPRSKDLQPDD
jgi:hypothetical protein